MFADVGYANVFHQVGLLMPDSSQFDTISTVSGGSWMSAQLFYSQEFYNRTALASSPQEINDFVVQWMGTYNNISTEIDAETKAACNFTDLYSNKNYDPDRDYLTTLIDVCYLLVKYDYDWATFIQAMMEAATVGYGTPGFVDILATTENRIPPLNTTDLILQASLAPNSRVRSSGASSTAVYLGHPAEGDGDGVNLWTVAISAAWVVNGDTQTSGYIFGTDTDESSPTRRTNTLQTYTAPTPNEFSWETWSPFYLFQGNGTTTGKAQINNTGDSINANLVGPMRTPFGNSTNTTVVQTAAASSAAAGSGSPLTPSAYAQTLSIGQYTIAENIVRTVWRVLAGLAAGIGAGALFGWFIAYLVNRWNCCNKEDSYCCPSGGEDPPTCCCCTCEKPPRNWGIGSGIFMGVVVGLVTGLFYGIGSIFVPTAYDTGVSDAYMNTSLDNFAVCSQWPNLPCQQDDAYMLDGWYVDNPALAINIGHQQRKMKASARMNETIKVILTNCNEVWDTEWNRAQYLAYFSTYFNVGIAPGDFSWGPGWYMPSRSQQIFSEYLDPAGLDALLEPIVDSNFTTALLQGTTVDNPAFNVVAGQRVEMILLNTNTNITTYVIGTAQIEKFTQPLADMASQIAGTEELVRRVRAFVEA